MIAKARLKIDGRRKITVTRTAPTAMAVQAPTRSEVLVGLVRRDVCACGPGGRGDDRSEHAIDERLKAQRRRRLWSAACVEGPCGRSRECVLVGAAVLVQLRAGPSQGGGIEGEGVEDVGFEGG